VVARNLQTSYYRANPFWTDPLRRARYIQRIALLPPWAKEVRMFGLTGWLADQYGREWLQVMAELWQARRADRPRMAALGCVLLAAHLLVVLLIVSAASSGALTVAAVTVVLQGLSGMAMIASLAGDTWIENGSVPVPDVLALEHAVEPGGPPGRARNSQPSPVASGSTSFSSTSFDRVSFDRVSFGYPGAPGLVLQDLELRIEAGTSLAVVGLNGAGKTTLVKLLAGLSRPTSGTVLIDGRDLAEIDQESWRRHVAAILQDFVRYELPLRDNIAFGAVERAQDDQALAEIARQAGLGSLLAGLPLGLDTTLSPRFEGGVDISGGQWQRLAFARALAAIRGGARMLVMDEPTAHLDVRAEAEFYARFLDLTGGLTTVVISHRFSTVRRADRIVVLAGGQITEDGSHDELVAAGGQYARMFALQASNYGSRDE
jgi:ATP-binding cassette subfamily B protein